MSYTDKIFLCCLLSACCSFFIILPANAFTANSLDIIISDNGDAIATFRFTLEGFIENAIPQSVLEEELTKGLTTSSEPPELKSMDRSSAVLVMKKFAETSDVPTGTNYLTASMDFKKAEIALQNSQLSSVVSADFSPEKITMTFPDSYKREFSNADVLPAIAHIVIDPSKTPPPATAAPGATYVPGVPAPSSGLKGSMNVTSSPLNVKVYLDSRYLGEAPAVFEDIGSGTHTAEFRKDGFETASKTVTIIGGKTTSVFVVLKYIPAGTPEETSSFPLLPVLVVIIVLIAVSAGVYSYWSGKKKKEWEIDDDKEADSPRVQDSAVREPVKKDIIIRDTKIREPEIRDTVVRVTEIRDPGIPKPEVTDTVVKGTEIKDPVIPRPKVPDTVVKVTMLKDIPDKETGGNDTNNKK